jgi:hypothetical protein
MGLFYFLFAGMTGILSFVFVCMSVFVWGVMLWELVNDGIPLFDHRTDVYVGIGFPVGASVFGWTAFTLFMEFLSTVF